MTYEEAREAIRNYPSAGISPGLERIKELCARLGNPEKKLSFVHIAGTNGKGSVAAYLSSILGMGGFLVGRYVSPVVFQYEECIQFENRQGVTCIDRELLAEVIAEALAAVERMVQDGRERPTIFEVETAMAFLAFVKRKCQIVLLEAGLGGREDATNVIENVIASVITPISRDHTGILGDTLTAIAEEKAGIIRRGVPVISFQREKIPLAVLREVCQRKQTELFAVEAEDIERAEADLNGCTFFYRRERYFTHMLGTYQVENACLAMEAVRHLGEKFHLDLDVVASGIRQARWRGRFEVVSREPLILVDGAHNESGAAALRESIEIFLAGKRIHGVMGCFQDKEYRKMVEILQPVMESIVTVPAPARRGLSPEILAEVWKQEGCQKVREGETVEEGVKMALSHYEEGDAVVVFGSLSLPGMLDIENILDFWTRIDYNRRQK